MQHLAIYAPAAGLALPDQAFGKDVANLGLYQALAECADLDSLCFLTAEAISPEQLNNALLPNGGKTRLQVSELLDFYAPCKSGILLRGQPYLAELAWLRAAFRGNNAYSLLGLIHTLAPPMVREQIGAVSIAPVQAWDALICTSPSVLTAMHNMFDQWEEYLQQRFAAKTIVRPHLPLIPLGVDLGFQQKARTNANARILLREKLQLSDQDVLVLWVGRLSYYEKAFPQSMFIALQRAADCSGVSLHFAMVGWFPAGEEDYRLYHEAAQVYCSRVSVHFLDGRNQTLLKQSWAAADIFLSLVDNPQETFGLSPVEAMAASLPVVVSDWDGYSYTVRDGLDGFLIPTLGGIAGGIGDELAARHSIGLMSYQNYIGAVAQHTAIDIDAAAQAITKLAINPELRRSMGASALSNVQARFGWPTIARQYKDLFFELAEIRSTASGQSLRQFHPLRGNPFADFACFATSSLHSLATVKLNSELSNCLAALDTLTRLDLVYGECHADLAELRNLLIDLANNGPLSLQSLLSSYPNERHQSLAMGVSWLAKLGIINWKSSAASYAAI